MQKIINLLYFVMTLRAGFCNYCWHLLFVIFGERSIIIDSLAVCSQFYRATLC